MKPRLRALSTENSGPAPSRFQKTTQSTEASKRISMGRNSSYKAPFERNWKGREKRLSMRNIRQKAPVVQRSACLRTDSAAVARTRDSAIFITHKTEF